MKYFAKVSKTFIFCKQLIIVISFVKICVHIKPNDHIINDHKKTNDNIFNDHVKQNIMYTCELNYRKLT
jgi:hypothetical protein